ncbi:MAG: methylmalonyl Co-A mutase-associated GTPase MeaB [Rhodothermales bacterium]|nr:methylmalonyl Co-A mutase-associated GTPase MeaB [Rhodothermales bacterium]
MADHRRESSGRVGAGTGARNPALSPRSRQRLTPAALSAGIQEGDRAIIGQALSLVESFLPADLTAASELLTLLGPENPDSLRLAVSGAPGAGKSTLIDAFGTYLTGLGHRVAVLAIDPTSARSGGSILGDKTRMPRLATDPNAFIRPSPTQGALGGVSRRTRPAMAVLEAAGYDVLILETVGVGQSETAARNMADFFLLLSLAGAGDELQGIKRGIIEVADAIAITKADGQNMRPAQQAAASLRSALHLFPADPSGWRPRVLTCSALVESGLPELWQCAKDFQSAVHESGYWEERRKQQRLLWFDEEIRARMDALRDSQDDAIRGALRTAISVGAKHPHAAAAEYMAARAST